MKNYQKSNVNNRRPGPTVGGRSQRWVSGAGQSGNTVAAENYYQHAEHYFRSMSSDRGAT